MSKSLYSIENVAIEGFKAFTKRQVFDFGGRHIFLFGSNGLGKTSIVEAIRWCLFGLATRPGETIKNQFYGGPCVVQMTLRGPDGYWTMQRRLRPSSGESDRTVRDPNGRERNVEDVFPQLSRIGPREGTHVIYAAQQPSSRRPEADITDFSYVVFRYLGLEEVPRLSDVLLALSGDWKNQEDELLTKVDSLGDDFSQRISEVDERLSLIIENPPWGTDVTPTNAGTRRKIDDLAKDAGTLGVQLSNDILDNPVPSMRLNEIEAAVNIVLSHELIELGEKLGSRSSLLREVESLYQAAQSKEREIQEQLTRSTEITEQLSSILDDVTIDELEVKLEQVESNFEKAQQLLNIVRASLRYVETAVDEGTPHTPCPTCGTEFQTGQLVHYLEELESNGDPDTRDLLEEKDSLQECVAKAKSLVDQGAVLRLTISQHRSELDDGINQAKEKFESPSLSSLDSVAVHVEELSNTCKALRNVLQSQAETQQSWKIKIESLRRELRFHQLRDLKGRLENLFRGRYEALSADLQELGDLRDIASELRSQINTRLNGRLQKRSSTSSTRDDRSLLAAYRESNFQLHKYQASRRYFR